MKQQHMQKYTYYDMILHAGILCGRLTSPPLAAPTILFFFPRFTFHASQNQGLAFPPSSPIQYTNIHNPPPPTITPTTTTTTRSPPRPWPTRPSWAGRGRGAPRGSRPGTSPGGSSARSPAAARGARPRSRPVLGLVLVVVGWFYVHVYGDSSHTQGTGWCGGTFSFADFRTLLSLPARAPRSPRRCSWSSPARAPARSSPPRRSRCRCPPVSRVHVYKGEREPSQ